MNAFGKFVLFSEAVEKEYIWSLGKSPVNTRELRNMLMNYTDYNTELSKNKDRYKRLLLDLVGMNDV
jgi:hypothetical protein